MKAIVNITTSIDGFIAGPGLSKELPMGENGDLLHDWMFQSNAPTDQAALQGMTNNIGAVVIGGNIYHYSIEDAWGRKNPFGIPAIVLTSREPVFKAEGFAFTNDGIHAAFEQAKATANGKNIWIMGGADIIRQFFNAGLIDEMIIHTAPMMLGGGVRLFDAIDTNKYRIAVAGAASSPLAAHVRYTLTKK